MPKMPTYESQRELTTQQPQFLQEGPMESEATQIVGQGLQNLRKFALNWANAIDTIQTTTYETNATEAIADIENRAAQEPDYNSLGNYIGELEKLPGSLLKGFSNNEIRKNAALDLTHKIEMAKIRLDNIFKKKAIEVGQVNALKLIDTEIENYINAPDDTGRTASEKKIKDILDAQVKVGIFSPMEGRTRLKQAVKNAQTAIKDRESLKAKEDKELQELIKADQNAREDELTEMQINMADSEGNPISIEELIRTAREAMNDGLITPKFAKSYIKSLKSTKTAKPGKIESISKYNELFKRKQALHEKEFGWGRADFSTRAQFRADVLDANAEGMITDRERSDLLKKHNEVFYKDPVFRDALNQIVAHASLYGSKEAIATAEADLHKRLMSKITEGKSPLDALDEVLKEKLGKELGEVSKKDTYGFTIGETKNGYEYIGNNQWRKK